MGDLTLTFQIINLVITGLSIIIIPLLNTLVNSHLCRDVRRSKCCGYNEIEFDKYIVDEVVESVKKKLSKKNIIDTVDTVDTNIKT